jgi:hypothetical protein
MADAFGPIKPAPASDFFVFDFTAQIGAVGGTITAVVWTLTVDASSVVSDPDPVSRILAPPTFSSNKTSALLGQMIDGVIYDVTANVTLSDARILTDAATLLCSSVEAAAVYLTVGQFRIDYPAFTDTVRFPDAEIQYYINTACSPPNSSYALNPCRWGQFFSLGLNLWVAHNLAVADMMVQRAGPPGSGTGGRYGYTPLIGSGVASSRSVNGVSVSYDMSLGIERDAGWWGLTPWGNQFLYYLRMAGSAPVHLLGYPGRADPGGYFTGPLSGPWGIPWKPTI